jgi:hypothetical protein
LAWGDGAISEFIARLDGDWPQHSNTISPSATLTCKADKAHKGVLLNMILDLKQNLNPPKEVRIMTAHTGAIRPSAAPFIILISLTVEQRVFYFYLQTVALQDRFLLIGLGPTVEVSRVHALTE